jgi:FMN reductase
VTVTIVGVAGGPEAGGRTSTAIAGVLAGAAEAGEETAVRASKALSAITPQV